MATPDPLAWLKADPLGAVLLRRGEPREFVADVCERAAILQHDAHMPELEAIQQALGYVPHEVRVAVEAKSVT